MTLFSFARQTGLEPATSRVTGGCSNQIELPAQMSDEKKMNFLFSRMQRWQALLQSSRCELKRRSLQSAARAVTSLVPESIP